MYRTDYSARFWLRVRLRGEIETLRKQPRELCLQSLEECVSPCEFLGHAIRRHAFGPFSSRLVTAAELRCKTMSPSTNTM